MRDKVEDIAESVENGVRAVGVKAGGALERAGKTITRITRKNDAQGSGTLETLPSVFLFSLMLMGC